MTRSTRLVALVTGGARGLGRAISRQLAEHGISLLVNYHRSRGLALELKSELSDLGIEVEVFKADVASRDEVEEMMDYTVKHFGNIDILINNAGIVRDRTLLKMSPEEWHDVLSVDLQGVFNCTQAAVRTMIPRRTGHIVNISSIVGQTGAFGQTNYAAAKAGVIGFTKAAALELVKYGIIVNAICPGYIDTDMLKKIPEEVRQAIRNRIPMKRFAQPEEIARFVRFLVLDGGYITGQVIGINGGLLMI